MVVDYLRVNMQCWIGDERNAEGRQLFAQITTSWNDRRRPFVCIAGVHPQSRKLVLVHRQYVGNCSNPAQFIGSVLDHGLQRWDQFKRQAVAAQQRLQSDRVLRQMQEEEFAQALSAEREEEVEPMLFQQEDAAPDQIASDPA